MLKWLLTIAIVVLIIGLLTPRARRNQPARPVRGLPGDVSLRWRDRDYFFPFVSTILLSALAVAISLLI